MGFLFLKPFSLGLLHLERVLGLYSLPWSFGRCMILKIAIALLCLAGS
jgi:hypothetical protein